MNDFFSVLPSRSRLFSPHLSVLGIKALKESDTHKYSVIQSLNGLDFILEVTMYELGYVTLQ